MRAAVPRPARPGHRAAGRTVAHIRCAQTTAASPGARYQFWPDSSPTAPQAAPDMAQHCTAPGLDRKSTRLNSSHLGTSYAVFCWRNKSSSLVHPAFSETEIAPIEVIAAKATTDSG